MEKLFKNEAYKKINIDNREQNFSKTQNRIKK